MTEIIIRTSFSVLAVILFSWFVRNLARSNPEKLADQRGEIRPEIWSAWLTVLLGLLFFGISVFVFVLRDGGGVALVSASLGIAIAGFMAPSVTSIHAVTWNKEGINGPSKLFGPTLGKARTKLNWSEVSSSGSTATGYWFVMSDDGRRIYWSYLYKGHQSFTEALTANCPSVELPNN